MRRLIAFGLSAALAASVIAGSAIATSGGAGGPSAAIAKKTKSERRVGAYRGTTEVGGTVSFRITKKRNVVGFRMPDVPVECFVNEQGTSTEPTYSKPPFTIKAPPMKLQGVAKFSYEDPADESGPFQGIHVDGKIHLHGGSFPPGYVETDMRGNGVMVSWNAPAFGVGTEHCYTEYVDWNAEKVGGKKK